MELAIYIKNLLYSNHKVLIPGFGILQTVYKPADINTTAKTISPPSNGLQFIAASAGTDQILSNFIAAQKSIDLIQADRFISDQIKILNEKLNASEIILMEGIGYFSKESGNIRFDQEQGTNFLTSSFGLSMIDYKPVDFKLSQKHSEQTTNLPVKRKKSYIIITLLIIILISGGAIVTYIHYPSLIGKFRLNFKKAVVSVVSKKADTLSMPAKDTAKKNVLEKYVDKSTDKKNALAINANEPSKSIPIDTSYYIIAGSFKTYTRASLQAKQLKKEGFKPEVIQFDQQLFRVSLGEFKDKQRATDELDKIKNNKGSDAVWLLTKRL